jgi:peptidoglycan L-alanyl-D-glutamate endopeptidase CwlK
MDVTILEGVRTMERQKELFDQGATRTLKSKHLKQSDGHSHAVDVAPWVNGGIPWDQHSYFYFLGGIIKTIAQQEGINLRWGGDWDGDGNFEDQTFNDLVHWEI